MVCVSPVALALIETGVAGVSPSDVGRRFFHALAPFGVTALFSRGTRPGRREDEVLARISPPGWEELYAERYFARVNFLGREVVRRIEPFSWSQIERQTSADERVWQTLQECGFPDGIAAPCHGPRGYSGVTSLAFSHATDISPGEQSAIGISAMVLHQRMLTLVRGSERTHSPLSPRERDCLAYAAEGRTDTEIADILGVSESTVITHVRHLRQKLAARNRAHAVAIGIAHRII